MRDPVYDEGSLRGKNAAIYCRYVCPVKHLLTKNVSCNPTAGSVERAAIGPALAAALLCPAWKGTKIMLERALQMIETGARSRSSASRSVRFPASSWPCWWRRRTRAWASFSHGCRAPRTRCGRVKPFWRPSCWRRRSPAANDPALARTTAARPLRIVVERGGDF